MAWTDVLLGGGLALAGTTLQQALAWRSDQRRHVRERAERLRQEQHDAFIELAKSGRRVQRTLVDLTDKAKAGRLTDDDVAPFRREVDALAEAVAVVRLVILDDAVVAEAEKFEALAKKIQRTQDWTFTGQSKLELTPLLRVLQTYEAAALRA